MLLSFGVDNSENLFLLGKYKQMELRFLNISILMINENYSFSFCHKRKKIVMSITGHGIDKFIFFVKFEREKIKQDNVHT